MNSSTDTFIRLMKNPIKHRIFLVWRLPSAFFAGVRVRELEAGRCKVSVPYMWFSQNPFHSTYFACLGMAAEMSTGTLALMHVYRRQPAVSMLVVGMEARFHKKAVGRTSFLCGDGYLIEEAINRAVISGGAETIIAKSIGTNEAGEMVAEFQINWSFKVKKSSI